MTGFRLTLKLSALFATYFVHTTFMKRNRRCQNQGILGQLRLAFALLNSLHSTWPMLYICDMELNSFWHAGVKHIKKEISTAQKVKLQIYALMV